MIVRDSFLSHSFTLPVTIDLPILCSQRLVKELWKVCTRMAGIKCLRSWRCLRIYWPIFARKRNHKLLLTVREAFEGTLFLDSVIIIFRLKYRVDWIKGSCIGGTECRWWKWQSGYSAFSLLELINVNQPRWKIKAATDIRGRRGWHGVGTITKG